MEDNEFENSILSQMRNGPHIDLDRGLEDEIGHEAHDILDEFLDHRVYKASDASSINFKTDSTGMLDFYDNEQYGKIIGNEDGERRSEYIFYGGNSQDENASYCSPTSAMYPVNGNNKLQSGMGVEKEISDANGVPENLGIDIADDRQLSHFEKVREELAKVKFGNCEMNPSPLIPGIPEPSYLDFSPETMAKLPLKLSVSKLPSCSRVETQIKINFSISPPPSELLLHIPQDLISKTKFCLEEGVENIPAVLKKSMLFLDAYVLTSDLKNCCNICSRCIKREQKRASRRKPGLRDEKESSGKNGPNTWSDENMIKKALIFNCKEIVSFSPPNGLNNSYSKNMELSARIICYCRHHKESEGFNLLFVLKNYKGDVVAKSLSSTIMIMDRKKNGTTNKSKLSFDNSLPVSLAGSSTNLAQENKTTSYVSTPKTGFLDSHHVLSPNSMDDSNSDLQTNNGPTEGNSLKRKKLSVDESSSNQTNPMYNGSNGFSPLSNSDTNTSATNVYVKSNKARMDSSVSHIPSNSSFLFSPEQANNTQSKVPTIQKIIPAQGPVRGGIEVTLLGYNFHQGLAVRFGANQALATHCWSETTIVTYLPPSTYAGQVLVSFDNIDVKTIVAAQHHSQQQIFTYTDDTDRQLIELALQLVGFKMNGKLEDAKNIAKRIVGTDNLDKGNNQGSPISVDNHVMKQANTEWVNSASKAIEELASSRTSTEGLLIKLLSAVDLPNCPIIIPNWQMCNSEGQTLLHLASLKDYSKLVRFLIIHGCKIDVKDNQGLTPLFLASMCGHRNLMDLFLDCKSNWNLKLSNDKSLKDYCDPNVLDVFDKLSVEHINNISTDPTLVANGAITLSKSGSLDSLSSLLSMNFGRHISRMVVEDMAQIESSNSSSESTQNFNGSYQEEYDDLEFADSEQESTDSDMYSRDGSSSENHQATVLALPDFGTSPIDNNSSLEVSNASSAPNDVDGSKIILPNTVGGLWQKVKNAFNTEDDNQLPSYDDLFPFGPSSTETKPKSNVERLLNSIDDVQSSNDSTSYHPDDAGIVSDSSEDMVLTYISKSRKTVQNDTMLLFFWVPVLICLMAIFFFVKVMGYNFEIIDTLKHHIRLSIGKMMIGKERIVKVFKINNSKTMEKVIDATIQKLKS